MRRNQVCRILVLRLLKNPLAIQTPRVSSALIIIINNIILAALYRRWIRSSVDSEHRTLRVHDWTERGDWNQGLMF